MGVHARYELTQRDYVFHAVDSAFCDFTILLTAIVAVRAGSCLFRASIIRTLPYLQSLWAGAAGALAVDAGLEMPGV